MVVVVVVRIALLLADSILLLTIFPYQQTALGVLLPPQALQPIASGLRARYRALSRSTTMGVTIYSE